MTATQDLTVTRTLRATPEQAWRAWTDPAHVQQWWGPTCFTCPSALMDVREGATSVVSMRAPADFGGMDYHNSWLYTKLVPHQTIEFIQNLCDASGVKLDPASVGLPPDFPVDQRNLITFQPLADGRTAMTITQFGWTPGLMMSRGEQGLAQSLDKLAATFA